jgi:hypothetical protein
VPSKAGTVLGGVAGALGCVAAAVLSGVGVLVLVALGIMAFASAAFGGCEGSFDLSNDELAVTRNLDGTLQVRFARCGMTTDVQTIVLRRRDGAVVWAAHRTAGTGSLASVTLGRAPEGFEEDVALAGVDDGVAYEVLLSPFPTTDAVTHTVPDALVVFASIAAFQPEQVHVGRYWFERSEMTEAQFRHQACR